MSGNQRIILYQSLGKIKDGIIMTNDVSISNCRVIAVDDLYF
ncbi:MAG: hypothetical protein OEM77_03060 [Nitrosopumilus sp.]|nr:hypothetical protein [Nitrosopumilus sp.]MDH3735827.1 hypothetical protein [Nitrosopumilus sp.]MDH3822442.1 hypothetical protein [Nitrosopumilus sp.]MDH3833133.1 hypothetical protein [Nitrosopumilus sp.]